MTDFPCNKKVVSLSGREVVIYDLSLGFLIDLEDKQIEDSFLNIIEDASNLKPEEIKKLRKSEAEFLVSEIMLLTYGEKIDDEEKGGDSKKS